MTRSGEHGRDGSRAPPRVAPLLTLTIGVMATPALVFAGTDPGRDSIIDPDWDVTQARGDPRQIEFRAKEGTWMSVDVSPDGKSVVFDLLGRIYRVPVTGGEARDLMPDSGIALNYHPRYSPNGTEIAFISDRAGQDNLWIMLADGTQARSIALDKDSRFAEPAWMPDGQSIVVTRRFLKPGLGFRRTDDTLWIYPRTGGAGREIIGIGGLSAGPGAPQSNDWYRQDLWAGSPRRQWPSVTPDGKVIYFHTSNFDGTSHHLQRIELESGYLEDVTEPKEGHQACCARPAHPMPLGEVAPEVSPDGRWLAFARRIPGGGISYRSHVHVGRTALWLRDLSTGTDHVAMDPITQDAMDILPNWQDRVLPGYSWARDGKSIFVSTGGKLRRLWIDTGKIQDIPFVVDVRRTISEMTRVRQEIRGPTFAPRAIRWAVTSPDGGQLAFEAVGQLWVKNLSDGMVRPLVGPNPRGTELTPAWSPDGRWIAYVSVEDELGTKGHVWKVSAGGGEPVRLTDEPATFFSPFWDAEGKTLYVSRWPRALNYFQGTGRYWELVRVSATGGTEEFLARLGMPQVSGLGPGGRIYYMESANEGRNLVSISTRGDDKRRHASLAGAVEAIVPSPDGRWLAVAQMQDIYLLPAPTGPAVEHLIDLHPAAQSLGVRRLSSDGGHFPRWKNDRLLEFASANEHRVYDVERRTTVAVEVGLQIAREAGHGTIALVGARLITLRGSEVVEKGTVVVADGRITCVGHCDVPGGAHVIDLSGKTIMPGWVDTHAHFLGDEIDGIVSRQRARSAVYIAYGITTAFDPAVASFASFTVSEMTRAGRLLGPRTYSTGNELTCGDAMVNLRPIATLQDAEEHVRRKARLGAPSVKDYKQCTRSQRQMLAEAARRNGLSLTTEHGPLLYLVGQIMNGHTGFEHPLQSVPTYSDVAQFLGQAGAHYSPQLFFTTYPHNVILENWMGERDLWKDPKLALWQKWERTAARRTFSTKPTEEYSSGSIAEFAKDLMRAGGYVTTGAHGEQDGLGLHWEAWTLGLAATPLEVLTAASLHGAHFLGLEKEVGSLENGKIADMVVLNSNPLDNIRNTTDNLYVMKEGKLYSTQTLEEIWPERKPFGPTPWRNPQIYRMDVRPLD